MRSGLRAGCPIEIVFDTAEILAADCNLFTTESEGVLSSDPIPGSCILFINDTAKDVVLWARSGGVVAEESTFDDAIGGSPANAEAGIPIVIDETDDDTPVLEAGSFAPPLSDGEAAPEAYTDQPIVPPLPAIADVAPAAEEPTAEDDGDEADASMPSVEERPPAEAGIIIQQPGPPIVTTYIGGGTATHVTINSYGVPIEAVQETVDRPEPTQYAGTEERPTAAFVDRINCCHCFALCLQGQRVCLHCGGPVKPGQLKAQGRRTLLARGREALLQDASDPRGLSASKDVAAGRGMNSLEGEVVRKAKVAKQRAVKKGYTDAIDRFNRDNDALSMTKEGYTRRGIRILDCLTDAYLPNPGRSRSQRKLAIGSARAVQPAFDYRQDDIPECRVVYFDGKDMNGRLWQRDSRPRRMIIQ